MILLSAIALATPNLPTRPAPVDYECVSAIPVTEGQAPSPDFIEPGWFVYACSGVVVPTSQVAHLLAIQSWAEAAEAEIAVNRSEPLLDWRGYAGVGFALGTALGVYIGSH